MRIHAIHTLEDLSDQAGKGFGKGYSNPAWEDLLVVDAALDPVHQVLDVFRRGHLGWALVCLVVLP